MLKRTSIGVLCFVMTVFLFSCRKHRDFIPTPATSVSSSQTRITGIVKDQTGTPLSGVTITAQGKTTVTGSFGEFNIVSSTEAERIYVKAEMTGYFTGTATEIASSDGSTNVQIILAEQVIAATLDASAGGVAQDGSGNQVTIPSDGIITAGGSTYSGDVNVSLLHLDPNSPEFGLLTQGADMTATNASGAQGALYSYGVLKVELTDDIGNELQLAPGKTSTVRMTIAPEQLATAPATIPLWYFDENAGKWVEDGVATKTGNEYVGTVSHFTDWNCDVFSTTQATVTGKVVDCSGKPVPFIFIQTGQSYAYTDQDGNYTRRVPSEIAFEITAETGYGQNYTSSASITVPALSADQTYTAPNLVLSQCLYTVTGTLKGCQNNPINGYVEANGSFGFIENGAFSIVVPGSDSVHVNVYDYLWGFTTKKIGFPSGETTVNAGDFTICIDNILTGENSFTINGNGYSNLSFIFSTPGSNLLDTYRVGQFIYDTSSTELWIDIAGMNTIGQNSYQQCYLDFGIFENNGSIAIGQYSLNPPFGNTSTSTAYLSFWDENTNQSEDYASESGTVTITRINNEGGLIEGTFSVTFRSYGEYVYDSLTSTFNYVPGPNSVTVSNGKFSVLRYPDYSYNYRVASSDNQIPAAVLNNRKKIRLN